MRFVSLLVVVLAPSVVWAQEGKKEDQQQGQKKISTTLAEAHAELERILSPQALAEIDAMQSEKDMFKYYFPLDLNITGWGLWRGGPLAKHMEELGFTHPDGMWRVILVTFWRKRHGQDLCLEGFLLGAKESKVGAWKTQIEEENRFRFQKARTTIRNLAIMAFLSVVLLTGGLACLIVSKIPLYRQGIWLSFGPGLMSKGYASLNKAAYVLMGMGMLLMLLLLRALRLQA